MTIWLVVAVAYAVPALIVCWMACDDLGLWTCAIDSETPWIALCAVTVAAIWPAFVLEYFRAKRTPR